MAKIIPCVPPRAVSEQRSIVFAKWPLIVRFFSVIDFKLELAPNTTYVERAA